MIIIIIIIFGLFIYRSRIYVLLLVFYILYRVFCLDEFSILFGNYIISGNDFVVEFQRIFLKLYYVNLLGEQKKSWRW